MKQKPVQVVRARLESRTEADCSSHELENNKVHYYLKYESSRGWNWIVDEVYRTSEDTNTELEVYKINTSGVCAFEIEVRELEEREDLHDEDQRDLYDFE